MDMGGKISCMFPWNFIPPDHESLHFFFNLLGTNPTEWSDTQTVRMLLPTNCLNVFGQRITTN